MKILKASTLAILLFSFSLAAWCCTGIELGAKDGSYVNGRTVEFGVNLDLSVAVIPRNYTFTSAGGTGLTYQSKYAVVGASTYGTPVIVDGMNEKGLTAAVFYFPGYASYTNITPQNQKQALSPTEFTNWVLTQFATTDEVKQNLKSVVIAPTVIAGWGTTPPPFHYVIYDKSGSSIVVEPIDGKLKVYDNPIGVITNSPAFDWHLTNLANYINLSPINAPPITVDGLKLQQFGQGSGLHGLPGDFTPPSRFVRAAIFSAAAIPSDNSNQAVLQLFHILNQFDIPVGAVQQTENNSTVFDYTIATAVKDPQTLKYYFKTYDDQSIKMIDLNKFDWDAKSIKSMSMKGNQRVTDVSMSLK